MDLGRIHLPEPRKTQPIGWHMVGANGMAGRGLEFDDFQLLITRVFWKASDQTRCQRYLPRVAACALDAALPACARATD